MALSLWPLVSLFCHISLSLLECGFLLKFRPFALRSESCFHLLNAFALLPVYGMGLLIYLFDDNVFLK